MKDQTINVWVAKPCVPQIVRVVQSDSGRVLKCNLQDLEIPKGATARIFALKPSQKKVYNTCTVSGNTVSVKLTTQMLAEAGHTPCQVQINYSNQRVTCFTFILGVQECLASDAAVESMDESDFLVEYTEQAKESAESAAAAVETATQKANAASDSAAAAKASEDQAKAYLQDIGDSREVTAENARQAKASADAASGYEKLAQSYAVGGTGSREGEDADNAKAYADRAEAAAEKAEGIVVGDFVTNAEFDRYTESTAAKIDGKLDAEGKAVDAASADKVANPLTFTGGSQEVYDGSKAVSVEIPIKPTVVKVTLSSKSWSDKTQTVTVKGVSGDETAQEIHPMPAMANLQAWMDSEIFCSAQAADKLTFQCVSVPSANITVYVSIWTL